MVIKAHITPEVLSWARDSAGYSVDEVVKKLNLKRVSSATIEAWERGEYKPTYAQLERLAEYYKRPIAVFYFPSPPEEDHIDKKFRSLPEFYLQNLSPSIRYIVKTALARQLDLYELHRDAASENIQTFKNNIADVGYNITKLASRVRDIISIPLNTQHGWKGPDEAMEQWRSALEGMGIWVFKDAFKDKNYSGFFLDDQHFPVMYVNSSTAKQRQIFTLFHELAHLILGKGGVSFRDNVENEFDGEYKREEIFCNAFAGEFLVPDSSLSISREPDDIEIEEYAKQYKVGREVILRKCLDKNLINQEVYNEKVHNWKIQWEEDQEKQNQEKQKQGNKKKGGPNYYLTKKSHLGNKYLNLAFSEYYKQRINDYQLSDYLGVGVKHLATFEGYMYQERSA